MNNINLFTCQCGSIEFEMIDVVKVSSFFEPEYDKGFSRAPTTVEGYKKLRCINCGKFYKEWENNA